MKLLLIGATGGIGRKVIELAREKHDVTALVRSPEKLSGLGVEIVKGNPLDASAIAEVAPRHDAVITCLGPPGLAVTTVHTDGVNALVQGLRGTQLRRVLMVSAAMLFDDAGFATWFVRTTFLRNVARDCARAEAVLTKSDLAWTIVRPPRLTDGPLTRQWQPANGKLPDGWKSTLSRADVADAMLAMLDERVGQVVGLAAA